MLVLLEWIKNPIHDVWINADARVVNSDVDRLRFRIGSENRDLALIGSKLDRVLEQVPNDLLELRGVAGNVMSAGAQTKMYFQAAYFRFRPAHFDHIFNDLVCVERAET